MIRGKTKTGFNYEADDEQINNAEFLEDYVAMTSGESGAVFRILEKVLGAKQKKELYDHIRDDRGNVPVDKLTEELSEIFLSMSTSPETKN